MAVRDITRLIVLLTGQSCSGPLVLSSFWAIRLKAAARPGLIGCPDADEYPTAWRRKAGGIAAILLQSLRKTIVKEDKA